MWCTDTSQTSNAMQRSCSMQSIKLIFVRSHPFLCKKGLKMIQKRLRYINKCCHVLDSFDSFLLRPLIFCCCHLKFTWSQVVSGSWPKRRRRTTLVEQGSLYYQPKQCAIIREIPQNYHGFVLFDPPNMGNFMTPVETSTYWYCWL